jgi:hypothetical protein
MTRETSRRKPAFALIADTLGETERAPRGKLRAIVAALGDEAAHALLAEVQQVEANGGMLLPDGSRRRTPGGVYFHLAYQRLTPEQRQTIYGYRGTRTGSDTRPPPPLPDRWADRGAWIDEVRSSSEEASTVKITLIGKLGKTIEKPGFTLAMLKHTPRLNALPKGIPRPEPNETSYVVYIGGKQWKKVKDALQNPEDVAIIEGTPMWDSQYEALAVFATNVTTKLTQQTKREQQQAQAT